MSKMSLKGKLLVMFGGLAVLLGVVGAVAVYALKKTVNDYEHVANETVAQIDMISGMRGEANESLRLLLQITLPANAPKEIARLHTKMQGMLKNYATLEAEIAKAPLPENVKPVVKQLAEDWAQVMVHVNKNMPLVLTGDAADRMTFSQNYTGDFNTRRQAYYATLNEAIKLLKADADEWIKRAQTNANRQQWLTVILVTFGFFASLLTGFFFSRGLSATLADLSVHLNQGGQAVSQASDNIANSSEELSSASTQQAAAVQETSASVEELTAMVVKNAEYAERSSQQSTESANVATRGKQAVEEMMNAIGAIGQSNADAMAAMEESNRNIAEITKVIAEIDQRTRVINDIVFQTKLLSFNASVEAARAGEHGKGFAVVAEEVGNLAQMSGNAAKEISQMLEASIRKVDSILADTKSKVESLAVSSRRTIEEGNSIAHRCGDILDQVVTNVNQVNSMVGEISAACKEQSAGIQEITKAMGQMDEATQQNAATSQTAAAAATELAGQSSALADIVEQMRRVIYGGHALASGAAPSPLRTQTATQEQPVRLRAVSGEHYEN